MAQNMQNHIGTAFWDPHDGQSHLGGKSPPPKKKLAHLSVCKQNTDE